MSMAFCMVFHVGFCYFERTDWFDSSLLDGGLNRPFFWFKIIAILQGLLEALLFVCNLSDMVVNISMDVYMGASIRF